MRSMFGMLCCLGALSGCGGYSVSGNDVTFEHCSENGCKTYKVEQADAKSFETLRGSFAKDRYRVYFDGGTIEDADPQSFTVLSDTYSKDNAHAYFERSPIPGADSNSFAALRDPNYGRDKNDLYMLGNAIGTCDVASFRWLTDGWQVDSKCAYFRGNKLPDARPGSFVVLNEWYAKDAEHVYSRVTHQAIDGADAATFRLAEGPCSVCARDKNRCYKIGENASCDDFPKMGTR